MSKKRKHVTTGERAWDHERSANERPSAEAPRDLQTEDSGVPRGDWSDEPVQTDADGADADDREIP